MTKTHLRNAAGNSQHFEPDSVESTVDWIKERVVDKTPFFIQGNGTNPLPYAYDSHSIPDAVLSTRKLKQVLFFDPDDMVAGMESGLTALEIQQILESKQMFLPVNPWYPDSTLGGMTASNVFGPNRMMMGGLRDYLIGIEYVNAHGELVHSGGKVVKNVSGYDLTRMMLGSLGGLGLITSVNFKVQPKPVDPHGLYAVVSCAEWKNSIAALHAGRLPFDWIQAVTCDETGDQWVIGIGYSGNRDRRERFEREIRDAFKTALISLADGEESEELPCLPGKDRYTGFLPPLLAGWDMPTPGLHLTVTMPTEDVLGFPYEEWQTWNPRMIVHPVGGDIHIFLKSGEAESHNQFLAALHEKTQMLNSTLRTVRCAATANLIEQGFPLKPTGYELAARLKKHLDPACIFHSPFFLMN